MNHAYLILTRSILLLFVVASMSGCAVVGTINLFERDGKLMGILPLENKRVVYRERIESMDLPKEEVFRRARRWWINNYRSAKDVFQLVDKETGEIVGKGYGTVYVGEKLPTAYNVYHVISVDVEEDYYTVTVYGLAPENPYVRNTIMAMTSPIPIERYNIGTVKIVTNLFREVDKQTRLTMASLHAYIKAPNI